MTDKKGLRYIAVIEAVKGLFGLSLGIAAALLPHHDIQALAEQIVNGLRLDPAAHYTSRFIREASLITAKDLGWVSVCCIAYGLFRFVEVYGLWRERAWAEWLALIGCALYVPFVIASLYQRATGFKIAMLVINLAIVAYLALLLARPRKSPPPAPPAN